MARGGAAGRSSGADGTQPRCQGQTQQGAACRSFAAGGRPYCLAHDPERHADVQAARAKGGRTASKLRALHGRRPKLDEPAALVRYTAGIIIDVAEGKLFADVGRVVLYGINIQRALLESSDLEKRLQALETQIASTAGKGRQRWQA